MNRTLRLRSVRRAFGGAARSTCGFRKRFLTPLSEAEVKTGQIVGWVEGFKAVSDIFSPLSGRFVAANPDLSTEIELLTTEPYGRGWLFKLRGKPGEDCLDVQGYVSVLDTTIDKMLGKRHE